MLIFQRLCWNTKKWMQPAGELERSQGDSFVQKHGIGAEEWNFSKQYTFLSDSYFYLGWNWGKNREVELLENGNLFDIVWWARDLHKNDYIVAETKSARLITASERDEYVKFISRRGRTDERISQSLRAIHKAKKNGARLIDEWQRSDFKRPLGDAGQIVRGGYVNATAKHENVEVLKRPIPLMNKVFKGGKNLSYHYRTPNIFEDKLLVDLDFLLGRRRQRKTVKKARKNNSGTGRLTPPSPAEIKYFERWISGKREQRERRLVKDFHYWFKNECGDEIVFEKNRIDIVLKNKRVSMMLEAKSVRENKTTFAIRLAIGQILEYNLYPGNNNYKKWCILIDQKPSKLDFKYIAILRKTFSDKLLIAWPEDSRFVFYPEQIV